MRPTWHVVSSIAWLALCSSAAAQRSRVDPRYEGHYVYAGTREQAMAAARQAVAPALERLDPLLRMIIESQARDADPQVPRVNIDLEGDRISIHIVDPDGYVHAYESRAGYPSPRRSSTMTQLFRDGRLEQVIEDANGMRRYRVFGLDVSGDRLSFETVWVTREGTFRFALPYRRATARARPSSAQKE